MIQRPQTLFFLAITALCLMLLFGDIVFYTANKTETQQTFSVEYDETEMIAADGTAKQNNTFLIGFAGGIAILSLVSIILFKNRTQQKLVSSINYLLILGFIVCMYLYSINMNYEGETTFTLAALMPMGLMFLNFLGIRGIKKDENLIRSMDRLR